MHWDITPENIFITKTGIIQLGDFGVPRILATAKQYADRRVPTPAYAPPEMV